MNRLINCKCSESWQDAAKLILRIVLGAIFIYHGTEKMNVGIEGVAQIFSSVGIPLANFFAPFVTGLEIIGGLALILGLFTHWVSKLFIILSLVAIFTVHITKGFDVTRGGYEFILLILASNIILMTMGAGRYSLDSILKRRSNLS